MGMSRDSERASTSHGGGEGESRPFRVAEPYGFVAFRPAMERGGDESLGHQRHPTYARRRDAASRSSPHGLARINLDIHQRFFLVRVTVGAPPLRVDVNRKSPRRISRESEIGGGARFGGFLDIIPVQMQGERLIRAPSQPYGVALPDAEEPHGVRNTSMRDLEL